MDNQGNNIATSPDKATNAVDEDLVLKPKFIDLKNLKTWRTHFEELEVSANHVEVPSLLNIKMAREWLEEAKSTPIPRMLFAEFWHEGEICILFADSNLGKSILAVQIGNSISTGKNIRGFKFEIIKQPVLYFDFELSTTQFAIRYSSKEKGESYLKDQYNFDPNFYRVEINPDFEFPENTSFEMNLYLGLERCLLNTKAKVLIIDNLTYLNHENEKARDASPTMKKLKALKSKYNLSMLVLAHTPKRDLSRPITQNDLQGSKILMNFADSSFAIGRSSLDKNIRYLKQIKERNTEKVYDEENIATFQIQKPQNFLEFDFMGFSNERDHLRNVNGDDRQLIIEEVKTLSKSGKSQREIMRELNISLGAVNKYLKL